MYCDTVTGSRVCHLGCWHIAARPLRGVLSADVAHRQLVGRLLRRLLCERCTWHQLGRPGEGGERGGLEITRPMARKVARSVSTACFVHLVNKPQALRRVPRAQGACMCGLGHPAQSAGSDVRPEQARLLWPLREGSSVPGPAGVTTYVPSRSGHSYCACSGWTSPSHTKGQRITASKMWSLRHGHRPQMYALRASNPARKL